ncbi:uncharacterized protein PFLUO_LOCUS2657 [Penicillium psychrofluorescens]|uniref:uncharacterized protein n=1 Tax=Penicillium psychrofluorescens TaxID=3158075 RepID=UPI003CCDC2CC
MTSYTHSDAFDQGRLKVSDLHTLHYEQYGKPDGKPVIFLHGGPGGNTSKASTVYFDPSVYRVVLLDQRGAGKSTPVAELRENTTHHLVSDIEVLRKHLAIPKWHIVFGGSWGSTLALVYAQTHPESVGSLVVRGIFTVRRSELEWSRGLYGAAQIFPEAYETYVNYLSEEDRDKPYEAYYKLLTSDDRAIRVGAAREWNRWILSIEELRPDPKEMKLLEDEDSILSHARLEAHYFKHGAWLEEGQILKKENLDKIRHIPTTIVQGRYDLVCAPQTAWDLHKGLPHSRLFWTPDGGHIAQEPGTHARLIEACDEYANLEVTQ